MRNSSSSSSYRARRVKACRNQLRVAETVGQQGKGARLHRFDYADAEKLMRRRADDEIRPPQQVEIGLTRRQVSPVLDAMPQPLPGFFKLIRPVAKVLPGNCHREVYARPRRACRAVQRTPAAVCRTPTSDSRRLAARPPALRGPRASKGSTPTGRTPVRALTSSICSRWL